MIQQVVLASSVDDRGEPNDPRTAFPEDAKRLVLCVRASDLLTGTQFRAVWFAGEEQLGQSDYVVRDSDMPTNLDRASVFSPLRARSGPGTHRRTSG